MRNVTVLSLSGLIIGAGFFVTVILASVRLDLSTVCEDTDAVKEYEGYFPFIDEFAKTFIPLDALPESTCNYGVVYVMSLASSIVIALNNLVIKIIVHTLTKKFERSHRRSNMLAKLVNRVAIAQYLNTCISMFFTYQPFADWGQKGNLIDMAVLFMMVDCFTSLLDVFVLLFIFPIIQKIKIGRSLTTKELNLACLPPIFKIEFKYAYTICTFMSAQFFFAVVPSLMIMVSISFLIASASDKFLLLRVVNSKNLLFYDEAAAKTAINLAGPLIVLTSVAGFIVLSTVKSNLSNGDKTDSASAFLATLEKEAYQPYSIIVWTMCLFYLTVPIYRDYVTRHKLFKRKPGEKMSIVLVFYRRLLGKGKNGDAKNDTEAKVVEEAIKKEEKAVSAASKFSKQKEKDDFFHNQKMASSYVNHYQAPTPSCMMPYQKMSHSLLSNVSIDASVVLDANGDGQIDAEEFKNALSNLGIDLQPHRANAIIEMYDIGGDGFVSTAEFMHAASAYVDDFGRVDFYAFAKGVVRELLEEFGTTLSDFRESPSSTKPTGPDDDLLEVEDGKGGMMLITRKKLAERARSETPPVAGEDITELENAISKTWKVEFFEKNELQLEYEDYEGTGKRVPPAVHSRHLTNRARAARAYHAGNVGGAGNLTDFTSSLNSGSPMRSPMPVQLSPSRLSPRLVNFGPDSFASPDGENNLFENGNISPVSSLGFGASPSPSMGAFSPPGKKIRGHWKDGKYTSAEQVQYNTEHNEAAELLAIRSKTQTGADEHSFAVKLNRSESDMNDELSAKVLNFAIKKGKDIKDCLRSEGSR